MSVTWVAGSGGLLGSAVVRAHGPVGLVRPSRPRWGTADAQSDVARAVRLLMAEAEGGSWRLLWCAGAGTTSTAPGALGNELSTFRAALDAIADAPSEIRSRGVVALASSAGGLYGGSGRGPFDETSDTRPLGAYGEAKLTAENELRAASERSGFRSLALRIANLYGPGQNLAKPQGLISHLAMSSVTRRPISVFVPLDTLRDYLFVDDAARMLLGAVDRASAGPGAHLKILCSGRAVSVAAILAEFARVAHPRPVVFTGASSLASAQSRDLRLRSTVWTELDALSTTTLPSGIARTVADVRRIRLGAGVR